MNTKNAKALPETVKSLDVVKDSGGDYIEIAFKNGAVLRVSAENDGLHYFSPNGAANDQPTVSMLVDMGAGMARDDKPTDVRIYRGDDCTRLDVNHL